MANDQLKSEIEALEKRNKEKEEYETLLKRKIELSAKLGIDLSKVPAPKKETTLSKVAKFLAAGENRRIEMSKNQPRKEVKKLTFEGLQ